MLFRSYVKAKEIVGKYEDVLHRCTELLLAKEKIGREEFEALFVKELQPVGDNG